MHGFWLWLVLALAGLAVAVIALYCLAKWVLRREPYASFMRLRTRGKIQFFRMVMADNRIPLIVKAIPVLTALYLAMPFDLIPDFIPVLGYMDDVGVVLVALALMRRLTPASVLDELMGAASADPKNRRS